MKIHAAILAGGYGLRLGGDTPKQFLMLGSKPLVRWSVDVFASCAEVESIVIACPENEMPRMKSLTNDCGKILSVVAGGQTRQASSRKVVNSINCGDDDIIVIHDAARPFVTAEMIMECASKAAETGAAGIYILATDTVAEISGSIVKSIPLRENLYYAQTPQAFKARLIKSSHDFAETQGGENATDDVSLVIAAGHRVSAVSGDAMNIKITSRFDYDAAFQMALHLEANIIERVHP
ncbi:MAG: 2-C-methyl-D-erythritol 4-phosphate cytidylyltransferase [Leptospirales bacterium]|nr:2-C-methyl-D-erythritol 4-phosphate cytidylyltransferase [Leptospirales bacterium]